MIRAGRGKVRETAKKPKVYETASYPAPVRGIVLTEPLAAPQPASASALDNGFPTATTIRVRGGSTRHATIGGPVESLFSYRSGGTRKFFGATINNVYEITAPASPTVVPTPDISGQTAGYYSEIPFTTAGGQFLYILNGSDDAQLYDGTNWAAIDGSSTPISITNVATNQLTQGCAYRNRLFFVQRNSMDIWYPEVGALGGALNRITMQGIYRQGGAVLFVATWSLDAGDGIDDKFAAVSTEGEIAVFEGSNPSDPADWNLVGVYEGARPLGKNAWLRVGGDLLILTDVGIIPLSQVINKDPAALSMAAVSRNIEPVWRTEAAKRTLPWEMVKSTNGNIGLVNFPVTTSLDEPYCYVVNLETGAWGRYTGWDTRCLHVFNELPYFGTNDGRIMLGENGGNDDGQPYRFFCAGAFDQMGAPGALKTVHQGRSSFLAASPFSARLGASVNYQQSPGVSPGSPPNYQVDEWDVGLWDEALWDSGTTTSPSMVWDVIGRTGVSISWHSQMTFGYTPTPRVELVSIDLVFEKADVAV